MKVNGIKDAYSRDNYRTNYMANWNELHRKNQRWKWRQLKEGGRNIWHYHYVGLDTARLHKIVCGSLCMLFDTGAHLRNHVCICLQRQALQEKVLTVTECRLKFVIERSTEKVAIELAVSSCGAAVRVACLCDGYAYMILLAYTWSEGFLMTMRNATSLVLMRQGLSISSWARKPMRMTTVRPEEKSRRSATADLKGSLMTGTTCHHATFWFTNYLLDGTGNSRIWVICVQEVEAWLWVAYYWLARSDKILENEQIKMQ